MSFADPTEEMPVAVRDNGQTMAEYAVCLGVISLAVVAAFTALSGGISTLVSNVMSFFH